MQTAHPFSTESHRNDGARLGLWSAAALVVGTIIGTGIFFFVSNVAALLPSPNWVLGVWATGGLVAVCGALCLAELTSRFPENGGMYIFLRRAFGESVAFEYVWVKFLVMRTGSYSIQMLAFATFACRLAGIDTAGGGPVKVVALIGLGFLTLVNIAGILWGGSLQNLLTALKILCLGGVIFVGLTAPPALPPSAMDISPAAGTMTLGLFFLALIPVMWTFGGWDESPFVAGEIRNPQKNVPVSILAGLGLCCVLFLLANAGYLRVLGLDDFASSGQNTAALFLEHTAGRWAGMILCGILMLSTLRCRQRDDPHRRLDGIRVGAQESDFLPPLENQPPHRHPRSLVGLQFHSRRARHSPDAQSVSIVVIHGIRLLDLCGPDSCGALGVPASEQGHPPAAIPVSTASDPLPGVFCCCDGHGGFCPVVRYSPLVRPIPMAGNPSQHADHSGDSGSGFCSVPPSEKIARPDAG